MYRALYRKWRPRDFDEVCGQEQVTDILKYQVEEKRFSHAYLFCGSRGTGKTTCAKILAKAVNCTSPVGGNPCHKCEACLSIEKGTAVDVIEMDAASNNGVDDVRDMKEEISFTPAELGRRVYIIDEVHMMTGSAFNALLKTLEEPPPHVMFILATTELQKLPSTIVSRCQRFDFRRITTANLVSRLCFIAGEEGIALTEDGARAIARMARGGMRDAISLLELCGSAGQTVDEALVSQILGSGSKQDAYDMAKAVLNKDYAAIFSIIDNAEQLGNDLSAFWQTVESVYRELLVVSVLPTAKEYLDLTDVEYEQLKALTEGQSLATFLQQTKIIEETSLLLQKQGMSRRVVIEMALMRMSDPRLSKDPESLLRRIEALERELAMLRVGGVKASAEAPAPKSQAKESVPSTPPQGALMSDRAAPPPPPQKQPEKAAPVSLAEQGLRPVKNWREVVSTFESVKPSYATAIRQIRASLDGEGRLHLLNTNIMVGGLMLKDEASMKLLLSLVAQVDSSANTSLPPYITDAAPKKTDTFVNF